MMGLRKCISVFKHGVILGYVPENISGVRNRKEYVRIIKILNMSYKICKYLVRRCSGPKIIPETHCQYVGLDV